MVIVFSIFIICFLVWLIRFIVNSCDLPFSWSGKHPSCSHCTHCRNSYYCDLREDKIFGRWKSTYEMRATEVCRRNAEFR